MTLSGSLNVIDRFNLAREAGFSAPDAITAVAISMLECGNCDMSSVNPSGDIGLMQINRVHWQNYGGQAALSDPLNSMRAAYQISSHGHNWLPWCTYPGGCGGPSNVPGQISWAQFQANVTRIAQQIMSGIPSVGDIGQPGSTPPGGTPPDAGGNPIKPPSTGASASGISAGFIGPFGITLPSGLVLALVGILLLIIGAMLFGTNVVKVGVTMPPVDLPAGAALRGRVPIS